MVNPFFPVQSTIIAKAANIVYNMILINMFIWSAHKDELQQCVLVWTRACISESCMKWPVWPLGHYRWRPTCSNAWLRLITIHSIHRVVYVKSVSCINDLILWLNTVVRTHNGKDIAKIVFCSSKPYSFKPKSNNNHNQKKLT